MCEHSSIVIESGCIRKAASKPPTTVLRNPGLDRGAIQHRVTGRVGDIVRVSCKHAEWKAAGSGTLARTDIR